MVKHSREGRSRSKSRSRSRSKSRPDFPLKPSWLPLLSITRFSSAEVEFLAGAATDQSHPHSATPEGMKACLVLQESMQ